MEIIKTTKNNNISENHKNSNFLDMNLKDKKLGEKQKELQVLKNKIEKRIEEEQKSLPDKIVKLKELGILKFDHINAEQLKEVLQEQLNLELDKKLGILKFDHTNAEQLTVVLQEMPNRELYKKLGILQEEQIFERFSPKMQIENDNLSITFNIKLGRLKSSNAIHEAYNKFSFEKRYDLEEMVSERSSSVEELEKLGILKFDHINDEQLETAQTMLQERPNRELYEKLEIIQTEVIKTFSHKKDQISEVTSQLDEWKSLIRKWDRSKEKKLDKIKGYNLLSIKEKNQYKDKRENILKNLEKHHTDHMDLRNELEEIKKAMGYYDIGPSNLYDKTIQKLDETTKMFRKCFLDLETLQKMGQEWIQKKAQNLLEEVFTLDQLKKDYRLRDFEEPEAALRSDKWEILIKRWTNSQKDLNKIKGYELLLEEDRCNYNNYHNKMLDESDKHHNDCMNLCNELERIEKAMKYDMGQSNLRDTTTQKLDKTTEKFEECVLELEVLQKRIQERVQERLKNFKDMEKTNEKRFLASSNWYKKTMDKYKVIIDAVIEEKLDTRYIGVIASAYKDIMDSLGHSLEYNSMDTIKDLSRFDVKDFHGLSQDAIKSFITDIHENKHKDKDISSSENVRYPLSDVKYSEKEIESIKSIQAEKRGLSKDSLLLDGRLHTDKSISCNMLKKAIEDYESISNGIESIREEAKRVKDIIAEAKSAEAIIAEAKSTEAIITDLLQEKKLKALQEKASPVDRYPEVYEHEGTFIIDPSKISEVYEYHRTLYQHEDTIIKAIDEIIFKDSQELKKSYDDLLDDLNRIQCESWRLALLEKLESTGFNESLQDKEREAFRSFGNTQALEDYKQAIQHFRGCIEKLQEREMQINNQSLKKHFALFGQ